MVYSINFKNLLTDVDWTADHLEALREFGAELKNIATCFYDFSNNGQMVLDDLTELEITLMEEKNEAKFLYKQLFENFMKRFGVFCEMNGLKILITIKKGEIPIKTFEQNCAYVHNYMFNL